jgi:hypothetical protein
MGPNMPELTITSPYVHSSPESTPTHSQWATVDHYPMPESNFYPSQGRLITTYILGNVATVGKLVNFYIFKIFPIFVLNIFFILQERKKYIL